MVEYWVNVYEYKTVKDTQFYSRCMSSKKEAYHREALRKVARPDARVVYRIHVKMCPQTTRAFYPYVWKNGKAVVKPGYSGTDVMNEFRKSRDLTDRMNYFKNSGKSNWMDY